MKERLIAAGLWENGQNIDPGYSIIHAWKVLSRLGVPYRYGGRSQDGLYEYLIIDPETGSTMASGKGPSLPTAMCEAALAARKLVSRPTAH